MLNPYLWYAKIAAGVTLVVALIFIGHKTADHWREQGQAEVQGKWDTEKATSAKAEQEAIQKRNKNNAELVLLYEAKNEEIRGKYERRIELQNRANSRNISDLRAVGGLRVPSSVCSGFASKTNSQSTERDNGESGTRLPKQIEDDLFQFAIDRDKEIIQLGTCQDWIISNGFYQSP